MTLTPDEREAAIEKMARAIAGCQVELGADKWRYCLPEARAALDAVLPLIERAVLLKAAAAIAKANEKVGCVETPLMRGDNLAILLCGEFDDGEDDGDDTGWSQTAMAGYKEVIGAIGVHYATAIRALADEVRT